MRTSARTGIGAARPTKGNPRGLLTPEKQRQLVGAIDTTRSLTAQHDYFAAYFDLHLKRRDTRLFRGDSPRYPDVRFIA